MKLAIAIVLRGIVSELVCCYAGRISYNLYAPAKVPMKKLRATVKANQGAGITSPLQSHSCKAPTRNKLITIRDFKIGPSVILYMQNIFW